MASERVYRINTPNVVQETIEDEAVVINLVTGRYYSLEGSASFIWRFIENERPAREITEAISRHFSVPEDAAISTVEQFIEELAAEGLVVPVENPVPPSDVPPESLMQGLPTGESGFSPPVLQKFTDMEDLLLLDPIHEVDDTGWPAIKPDSPKQV